MDRMTKIIITFISIYLLIITKILYAEEILFPAIKVDDMIITQYEIDQRALFFKVLNFPGNHKKEAKTSLIHDRLKMKAAKIFNVEVTPDKLENEMAIFANRANLTVEEFAQRLKNAGVDRITWEAYMQVPILWLETVSKRFASDLSYSFSEQDIIKDFPSGSEIQLLLTEIIIPVQPGFEQEAYKKAQDLRKIKSIEEFSDAAHTQSVAPTKNIGGKIDWQKLSDLPSLVKPLVFGLSVGEVSEPLPIPGGIAIFQLRDLRETNDTKGDVNYVEFIDFKFKSNAKLNSEVMSSIFMCEDIYTFKNSSVDSELKRKKVKENSLTKELKNILSDLDENEFILRKNDTEKFQLIMVCGRSENENISKSEIRKMNQTIADKMLLSLANSYLEKLHQEARIIFK